MFARGAAIVKAIFAPLHAGSERSFHPLLVGSTSSSSRNVNGRSHARLFRLWHEFGGAHRRSSTFPPLGTHPKADCGIGRPHLDSQHYGVRDLATDLVVYNGRQALSSRRPVRPWIAVWRSLVEFCRRNPSCGSSGRSAFGRRLTVPDIWHSEVEPCDKRQRRRSTALQPSRQKVQRRIERQQRVRPPLSSNMQ
jgi:hypothetical protein